MEHYPYPGVMDSTFRQVNQVGMYPLKSIRVYILIAFLP